MSVHGGHTDSGSIERTEQSASSLELQPDISQLVSTVIETVVRRNQNGEAVAQHTLQVAALG